MSPLPTQPTCGGKAREIVPYLKGTISSTFPSGLTLLTHILSQSTTTFSQPGHHTAFSQANLLPRYRERGASKLNTLIAWPSPSSSPAPPLPRSPPPPAPSSSSHYWHCHCCHLWQEQQQQQQQVIGRTNHLPSFDTTWTTKTEFRGTDK
jgi:hypothetical protein